MLMITIDYLKNHTRHIPKLVEIWHQRIGSIWVPDSTVDEVIAKFQHHLQEDELPLTVIALDGNTPIGMCSLRKNDGILLEATPWLGSLVVDTQYQKQGVGRQLIEFTKQKAKLMGYDELFLFAFDPKIPNYYQHLGWKKIGMNFFRNHPITIMKILL